jgi:hypothetical protein
VLVFAAGAGATGYPGVSAHIEWAEKEYVVQGERQTAHVRCESGADEPLYECYDSNDVTFAPAGETALGEVELETAQTGTQTLTLTAQDFPGSTASQTITYDVVTAPSVQTELVGYDSLPIPQGEFAPATFTCSEGEGGPGIESCEVVGGSGSSELTPDLWIADVELETAQPGEHELTVQTKSKDGLTASATVHYTVAEAPIARIESPEEGQTYIQGEATVTEFACEDGTGGSGIESCEDSNGVAGSGRLEGSLDTEELGEHEYSVTARSSDGQTSTAHIKYKVIALVAEAHIASPGSGEIYSLNQSVTAYFYCNVNVCDDSNGKQFNSAGSDELNTTQVGEHEFTVMAETDRGEKASATIKYTVVGPPTGAIQAPSAVTPTSATLNATVNPEGKNVTACTFEYGRHSTQLSSVPCSALPGSGTSAVAVSAGATGLKPGTGYFVRISVASEGGKSTPPFTYFKTPIPSPTIEPVSAVTPTTTTFNASVNPEGKNVTACTFEYGPHSSQLSSIPCSALPGSGTSLVSVSATATGLSTGSGYFVRISIKSEGASAATPEGGSARSSFTYFKTAIPAPTIQPASALTPTTATFNASVNPEGRKVTSCTFEYGPHTTGFSNIPCTTLPGSGTSPVSVSAMATTGLRPGTGYFVRISIKSEGASAATPEGGNATSPLQYFKTLL